MIENKKTWVELVEPIVIKCKIGYQFGDENKAVFWNREGALADCAEAPVPLDDAIKKLK